MPDLHITYDYGSYIHVSREPWYAAVLVYQTSPRAKLRCGKIWPCPTMYAAACLQQYHLETMEYDAHDWNIVTAEMVPSDHDSISLGGLIIPTSILHRGVIPNQICDAVRRQGEAARKMLLDYKEKTRGG